MKLNLEITATNIREEKKEIKTRLDILKEGCFTDEEGYYGLNKEDRQLVYEQCVFLDAYYKTLDKRLKMINKEIKKGGK